MDLIVSLLLFDFRRMITQTDDENNVKNKTIEQFIGIIYLRSNDLPKSTSESAKQKIGRVQPNRVDRMKSEKTESLS